MRSSAHETTTSSSSRRSSRRKSIATRARTKSQESPRLAERAVDPLVAALLEVGRVDGVVDVHVRVDVAPSDLDALLVLHGAAILVRVARMRAVTGVRLAPLPALDRRRRRVAAQRRGGRDGRRERRPGLGRQPEPRRGRRASAATRASPSCRNCPSARSSWSTTSASRRRSRTPLPPVFARSSCPESAPRQERRRRPTTERLAARARELGAALLGPNCMGFFVPGGAAAWNGRPQDTTRRGPCRRALPVGLDRRRVPLARRAHRPPLRRLVRRRGGHRRGRLPRVLRRGSGDARRRVSSSRPCADREAFVDALRRCAEADKPVVCLKVGRSEAAARAALSHTGALVGSDRAFSAVLRRYSAIEVGDFHELVETLEILGRDRWPSGTRIAGSLRVGRRVRAPRRPRGGRGHSVRAAVARARSGTHGGVSELPRARQPARRLGHRRRDRGLPAVARAPRRVGRVRRPRRAGRPLPVPRSDERRVVRADAAHARTPRATSATVSSAR